MTSAAASQYQSHSTISSLSEQTCPSSIPISSLYESSDQVNHYDFGEDSDFNDDTFEHRCYFNASNENCYLDVDIFEDGVYFIDGYAEDCYLTDAAPSRLQGKLLAQRWPRSDQDSGSNQDASTTNRWRSRTSYFHARTGAKYGSNCTPKVQVKPSRGELRSRAGKATRTTR